MVATQVAAGWLARWLADNAAAAACLRADSLLPPADAARRPCAWPLSWVQDEEQAFRTYPCTYRTLTTCLVWMVRTLARTLATLGPHPCPHPCAHVGEG